MCVHSRSSAVINHMVYATISLAVIVRLPNLPLTGAMDGVDFDDS